MSPFDSSPRKAGELELANALLGLMPVLIREIRSELNRGPDLGLSLPQLKILSAIQSGATSNKDIASAVGVDVTTMSRMVQALAERGFLEKTTDTADRRGLKIRLSKKGFKTHQLATDTVRERLSQRFTALSRVEQKRVSESLRLLIGSF